MSASQQKNKSKQQQLVESVGNIWEERFAENSQSNVGAEKEDIIRDSEGVIDNEDAVNAFQNLIENEGIEPETEEINGEEKLFGVTIDDENFQRHEDFSGEIDTDYHPAQSEIATEVFQNPADMIFRMEHLSLMRDRNLPEGQEAYENGLMREFATEGGADSNRRPKPRYTGLRSRHGEVFDAMGWPASTQLNTGTPVGEEQEIEEFFHSFFNGGEKPGMLDVIPGVDVLFANDPIIEEDENGVYEAVAEGGRDLLYDLFVSDSPAVLRNGTERWGDLLDESIPTNENYGNITDLSDVESHEDYIEMVMERPMILSPEIGGTEIQVLDEETYRPVGTIEEEHGIDSTWVMPGLSGVEESVIAFEQFVEDQQYFGEILVEEDGEEVMKPVKVDHSDLPKEEFLEIAGLGGEDDAGYFTYHNTFVRPDIAPKNDGIIEFRSFSNSQRSHEAFLTQKSLINAYNEVQRVFQQHGLDRENALEFREETKRDGLDATLPNGLGLEAVYENQLVYLLTQGVKESFSSELPYSAELLLDDADNYESFEGFLDSQFDDLSEFAEYTANLYNEKDIEPGTYSVEEFGEDYNDFVDWFAESYRETMLNYIEEGTEAEKIQKQANSNSIHAGFEANKRGSSREDC